MGAFKSNWNGVTNTRASFGALRTKLKNILTTCFCIQHSYTPLEKYNHQQQQHSTDTLSPLQAYIEHSLDHSTSSNFSRDFALVQRHSLGNWQQQLQLREAGCLKGWLPTPVATTKRTDAVYPKIVAKFLSSTPIANFGDKGGKQKIANISHSLASVQNSSSNKMTIIDDKFTRLRDEYPDLDREVRSILMARAQDGATIAEIKKDYRKNTGLNFPIIENILSFLLTIPRVAAICSSQGTLYFNIMPTSKTQHLFDLVKEQKPQQQIIPPRNWRHNSYRKDRNNRKDSNVNSNNQYNNQIAKTMQTQTQQQPDQETKRVEQQEEEEQEQQQEQQHLEPKTKATDLHCWQNDNSGESAYYQDNCNHLYSRYNQHLPQTPLSRIPASELNMLRYNNSALEISFWLNKNENEEQEQLRQEVADRDAKLMQKIEYEPLSKRPRPNVPSSYHGYESGSNRQYSISSYPKSGLSNDSCYISCNSEYEARIYDFPLLGDDFFLYLARMEMGCKFKKNKNVYESGLCVSGQTIRTAIKRVRSLTNTDISVIVNIGSVDILKGRSLVQIEHDYRELVNIMHKKGITPILTTLAPLGNYMHMRNIKETVERFNAFIKRLGEHLKVIDIWSCFTNKQGYTLFDCYQKAPRSVTGTNEAHLFWNNIGRQIVLKKIMQNLEY